MEIVCEWKDNKWISNWPCVDYREEKVDVLRDPRIADTLFKQGLSDYWNPVPMFSLEPPRRTLTER